MRERCLFPLEKAHFSIAFLRPDVLSSEDDIAKAAILSTALTNYKSLLSIYHRLIFINMISFSEYVETSLVLISSEPAPLCGNPDIIFFLDRCLSRLCVYKIASRDPLGKSEFGSTTALDPYVELKEQDFRKSRTRHPT